MEQPQHWHNLSIQETFDVLESKNQGLTAHEAERRLDQYGPNQFGEGKRTSRFEILLAQIKNPLVYVLMAAALISLIAGKNIDAIVISIIIIINTLIGYFQEYRAEAALEALMARAAPEAVVVRKPEGRDDYIEMNIPASELVPGDILLLSEGAKVPADARLIEAYNFEVDEAMLTGESFSVPKTKEVIDGEKPVAERRNLVYGGTVITRGRGRAIIYATGANTEMGEIATLIMETEKAVSPLQIQTADLGKKLGILAVSVASITVLIGLIVALELHEMFLFGLASAVSSIPEGLPAVMSITLTVGVNRMAKQNALIRRLPAVDTLGAASVICSDKTGTLTTNKMTVQIFVVGKKQIQVTGVGYKPYGEFHLEGETVDPCAHQDIHLALKIGTLCNDARLIHHPDDQEKWEIRGDPTEAALVVAAAKADCFRETAEDDLPRIDEIPFNSADKYMVTFHQDDEENTAYAFVKGAPEKILSMCQFIQINGKVKPLSEEMSQSIDDENHELASEALRVLGLAYKKITHDQIGSIKESIEKDQERSLTFVGLAGMMDPPRPEVHDAVQRCKNAGIRVIMATGDHKLTAQAIGHQVGILEEGDQVITGAEMDKLDDDALDKVLESTSVFARVAPHHKHRLVGSLQRHGYVVGMTGDGVNDAPALQAAEIGIAMGISGTDVTKETAEMILTDDNFASIVNAVEEGRVIFKNVQKVVKFLLATNIGEDLTLILSLILFASKGLIISPVQILWVNLVTDGILDVTLAMEPKEADVMEEPPRKTGARIIDKGILFNILLVASIMAGGTLLMYQRAANGGDQAYAQTIVFSTLAMFQVFNALNCRSRTISFFKMPLLRNPYLLVAIISSILLQLFAVYVPFMQNALGTSPLRLADWGIILLVTSTIFIVDEIRKQIQRQLKIKKTISHKPI